MATEAARKAALETSEIVDAILQYLPAKQLYVLQRVNKTFRAVITTTSPSIKQKLLTSLGNEAAKPRIMWKWDPQS